MKNIKIVFLCLLACLLLLTGCNKTVEGPTLNEAALADYAIVYSENAPAYNQRAAEYIQSQILDRTGITLQIHTAESHKSKREILVGETDRELSQKLDANTNNVEFAIMADEKNIALEGDYFIIAAAAYYFVQTYIPGEDFDSLIPQSVEVYAPITEAPNNYIFLIGDGMGELQTRLFERFDIEDCLQTNDGEDQFYGYYLPYSGKVRTDSLSGTTDSAAGATALATGVSTTNRLVGRDAEGNDLVSLTELANSLGMATAVMSTDKTTGATPAGFSAHANDRDDSADITVSQKLIKDAGTKIVCGLDDDRHLTETIAEVLAELDQSENGFFLMYEEGHIDKHCHNSDLFNTFGAVVRFNQAIGVFMEYVFYHPDTMLWITADHETGGLRISPNGTFEYTRTGHSSNDVPIFAYGQGAERFDQFLDKNTAIPKYIASLWGVENFGA